MLHAVARLDVEPLARLLRALGDETRLRIVALLTQGELCVCHIEAALDVSQPNASRQLGVLRSAGVVRPRREGNWVYYGLAPQPNAECGRVLQSLVRAYRGEDVLRRDVERLVKGQGSELLQVIAVSAPGRTPASTVLSHA